MSIESAEYSADDSRIRVQSSIAWNSAADRQMAST